MLQVLSVAVSSEKHGGTLDNICGALSRMIITNAGGIPMNEVSKISNSAGILNFLEIVNKICFAGFPGLHPAPATSTRL